MSGSAGEVLPYCNMISSGEISLMNRNIYLNVVVTVFLLVFLCLGTVLIIALDRQRFVLEELSERIRTLESRQGPVSRIDPGTFVRTEKNSSGTVKAANREYFEDRAVPGGHLRRAFHADAANMNMLICNDSYVSEIWSHVTDPLAERNYKDTGSGKFESLLAESWQISPDRKKIRIKLRSGILWHDFTDPLTGKKHVNVPVRASDFAFFLEVLKDPAVDCAPLRVYYKDLQKIRVINDLEFEVIWQKPYFLMEDMTLSLMPLPRHLYHAYEGPFDGKRFNDDHIRNRMIVGCGPYRFKSWEKGKRIQLCRFENYYGKSLGIFPPLETLSFDIIQHENTRLQSLLSGDLDMVSLSADHWVNRTNSAEFSEKGFLKKYSYASFGYTYIGLNQRKSFFREKAVRQALNFMINREKIRKEIFRGLVRNVTGPFAAQSSANDPAIKPYPFDPQRGRKLLEQAGWKDQDGDGILEKAGEKLSFTILYPNGAVSYQKMLPVIREDMRKAGVEMNLLAVEWAVLVQRLEKKNFEACMLGWTGSLKPDPYQLWHSSQAKVNASSNHISFVNARADELIEKIRTCFEPEKRNAYYHAFHKLIYDESPYLFLFSPENLAAIHKRYKNVRIFPGRIPTRILHVDTKEQMRAP